MENGHEPSRLDPIETALEPLVRSPAHLLESQSTLEREHKNLLRAQVVMSDSIDQIAIAHAKTETALAALTIRVEETTDKLNALISLVDRQTRGNLPRE